MKPTKSLVLSIGGVCSNICVFCTKKAGLRKTVALEAKHTLEVV